MASSKFVIRAIEQMGYHTFIEATAPTSEFTEVEAYYNSGSNGWKSLGIYQNYETSEFTMQAINTPASGGGFPVVVCRQDDGPPPNASSSDLYFFEFPNFD